MPKAGTSLTRRLDAWAEGQLARRFPRLARLPARTLYQYLALVTTLAWLVLRIPRWGPRLVREDLGLLAFMFMAMLVVDQVATQVRRRRQRR